MTANYKPLTILRTSVPGYWAVCVLNQNLGISVWVDLKLDPEEAFLDATWNEAILSMRRSSLSEEEERIYLDDLDLAAEVATEALYEVEEIYHGEDGDWYNNVNNWKEKTWWITK